MALMLGVGDESAGYVGHKEVKRKWEDTSSPHGITPGTINNIEREGFSENSCLTVTGMILARMMDSLCRDKVSMYVYFFLAEALVQNSLHFEPYLPYEIQLLPENQQIVIVTAVCGLTCSVEG